MNIHNIATQPLWYLVDEQGTILGSVRAEIEEDAWSLLYTIYRLPGDSREMFIDKCTSASNGLRLVNHKGIEEIACRVSAKIQAYENALADIACSETRTRSQMRNSCFAVLREFTNLAESE